jgi:AraC family transcriptional regulator
MEKVQPEIVRNEGFKIVGVERYTENGRDDIMTAWNELIARTGEIKHMISPQVCYGFEDYSRNFKMTPGEFPKYHYLAAWEVDRFENVPVGMTSREFPASTCARFRYNGPMQELHDFFLYIYGEWLKGSDYDTDPTMPCDFERYPEKMTDMNNASLEVWLPVVPKKK